MRHQLPLSPLQLTPDEIKQFHRLAQAHRSPQAMARRTRIVLTAHSHPDALLMGSSMGSATHASASSTSAPFSRQLSLRKPNVVVCRR
jgi:hypothetical protein